MKKLTICFSVLAMLMAGQTFAGTFWASTLTGDADSGISSDKTYTHAYNLCRATHVTDVVINGVDFTEVTAVAPAGLNYSTTNFTGTHWWSDYATRIVPTGSIGTLLEGQHYGGLTCALTLTGLTEDQEYITTFYNMNEGAVGDHVVDITTSYETTSYSFDQNYTAADPDDGKGYGNMLKYSYTADASGSITFTFVRDTGPFKFYGFSNEVSEVPEPSMVLLIVAGMAMLVVRKKFA